MLGSLLRNKLCLWCAFVALGGLPPPTSSQSQVPPSDHNRKQPELKEPRDLYPSEKVLFTAAPPLMVESGIKCDSKGNIYLIYTDAPQVVLRQRDGVATLPISELSVGSKSLSQYMVPSIPDHHHVLRYDFDVDARGKVYALLSTAYDTENNHKPQVDYFIVGYKDDGSVDTYIKIGDKSGERIQPIHLAAFPDGNFLVTGTAVKPEGLGTFSAVFDKAGTFVSNIALQDNLEAFPANKPGDAAPEDPAHGALAPQVAAGAQGSAQAHGSAGTAKSSPSPVELASSDFALSATDGNIYLLRGSDPGRLYAVSSTGQVVREFEVRSPAAGLSPIQMAMAGEDRIFFEFAHVATGTAGEDNGSPHVITEVDSNTGEVTAAYRLAPSDAGFHLAGCAASPYDFLFVGTSTDNKYLEVVRYSPRVY